MRPAAGPNTRKKRIKSSIVDLVIGFLRVFGPVAGRVEAITGTCYFERFWAFFCVAEVDVRQLATITSMAGFVRDGQVRRVCKKALPAASAVCSDRRLFGENLAFDENSRGSKSTRFVSLKCLRAGKWSHL